MLKTAAFAALCLAAAPLAAHAEEPAPADDQHAAEPAGHEEKGEEAEGLEQELALDLGVEEGEALASTAELIYGLELAHHEFIIGAAVAHEGGETFFADATVGYYHSFELGWVKPEIGVELGVLNQAEKAEGASEATHHLVPLERVGVGLIHDFSKHLFAGLVGDVAFAKTQFADVRGMFEIGVKL